MPKDPDPSDPESTVDLSKRYDIYCTRYGAKGTIVYRNVLIKKQRSLFTSSDYDVLSKFIELEHANGSKVFVSRTGVTAFCEHGNELGATILPEL